jgi:hypothetical protein
MWYSAIMTRFAFALALMGATHPAFAEEKPVDQGLELFSQGAELLLRGLMDEIEPALRDIEPRLRELRPFMRELEGILPDINLYHLPEVLPNGDIIIRRKTSPQPEEAEKDAPASDPIEL